MSFTFKHPYNFNEAYSTGVAYFCMEFAIHQPLKTYAGGLGYLSGSHMRSAFQLKQNMVGISILWKYGYYDQVRKHDQTMYVLFQEKQYGFLQNTGIKFPIQVAGHTVIATAYYLAPETFNTAPIFFLSTDLPENDYLGRTICHKLYDPNPETSIAAAILLGVGGAKLLEMLNWHPRVYHLNESHALPLVFYLIKRFESLEMVKQRFVFTNHTPEPGGNKKTDILLLDKFGYFSGLPLADVRKFTNMHGEILDHTSVALRLAGIANAVSQMHLQTIQKMWDNVALNYQIVAITNAQNFNYWADKEMYNALHTNDEAALQALKRQRKTQLFEEVAEQTGEIYDKNIFTLVLARRFAGYKRLELLLSDMERFHRLVTNNALPVQIIWAGKPYPSDYAGIASFDKIVNICKTYTNCAILAGYELKLSRMLKQGADVWLNMPRLTHEASGTSGMTAAMNGAINMSIPDGWVPEFARDKQNCFIIPPAAPGLNEHQQDDQDAATTFTMLENEVIPMYYHNQSQWMSVLKNSMRDIVPQFDSDRMAKEYYQKMYLTI